MTGTWRWLLAAMVAWTIAAPAAEMTPSEREPSDADEPVVTLVQGGDETTLSLADIEQSLTLFDTELEHFEGPSGTFTGVRLRDLLAEHGLDEARRVRLTGSDGYTIFLDREEIEAKERLLATRLDGEPIPADAFGPLMLMVPAEADAALAGETSVTKWIWAVTTISGS
ncbi:MAG: molybdopterin-dependent oxidoreductase [Ectothiorhodospiraceae bacterium]